MKRYLPFILGTVLGLLLAVVFSVGRATALGPPCFSDTNGHLFETFICWMFDNGLTTGYGDGTFGPDDNITRGQMAVFLQRMRSLGETYINAGPNDWQVNSSSATTAYIRYYPQLAQLRSTATGFQYFQLTPDIPSNLYDSQMYLHGAQLCYDALDVASAILSTVEVALWNSAGGMLESVTDTTDHTDEAACRSYLFSTPQALSGSNLASMLLAIEYGSTLDHLSVSVATFVLSPSADPPVLGSNALLPHLDLPFDAGDGSAP